jgi:hypothetical protein
MNARTLIITAGALVALAAPAVASAKLSPAWEYQKSLAAKKHSATHAKQVFKRQGQSRQIYTYYPAPGIQSTPTLEEVQAGYNLDLIEHGLAPIQFPDTSAAPAASDDSSAATTSDTGSTTAPSDSTSAPAASVAAAPATPLVDDSDC